MSYHLIRKIDKESSKLCFPFLRELLQTSDKYLKTNKKPNLFSKVLISGGSCFWSCSSKTISTNTPKIFLKILKETEHLYSMSQLHSALLIQANLPLGDSCSFPYAVAGFCSVILKCLIVHIPNHK